MTTVLIKFVHGVGQWAIFVSKVLSLFVRDGLPKKSFISQMYLVGVRSVSITCISGIFVGAILAIQIDLQLRDFGAQSFLGGLSTSTTLRNLGPVLIAFLLAGRVGAYTAAELGTMAITDQLSAIRCLGLNPLEVIVLPRLAALICSSFLLLILGLGMTVVGGMLLSATSLSINPLQFLSRIPDFLSWNSILLALIKSFVFGLMIGTLSCFFGYNTSGSAESVGMTVRRTAVFSLLSIIVMDFLVSWLGGL